MSLTGNDRKVRSGFGKRFPEDSEEQSFSVAIAEALRREFGAGPASVRKVAHLTSVNERAVKNWFDARNAPNGKLLVRLIEQSDQVLEAVLALARREQLLKAKKIHDARTELLSLLQSSTCSSPDRRYLSAA